MTIDLEPCPFCGSAAMFTPRTEAHGMIVAGCEDPDCLGFNLAFDFVTEAFAAEAWNTRAPTAAARERDGLREALSAVLDAVSYHEGEGGRRSYGLRPSFGEAYQQARQALKQETQS